MRSLMLRFVAGLVLALAVCQPALAQGTAQPPLSAAELDRFMADYPAYRDWIRENVVSSEADYSAPIAAHLKSIGWENDRYFHVLSAVTARLAELSGQQGMDEALKQMRADRDRLKDNPNLPPADKEALLAEIDKELGVAPEASDFDSGLTAPEKKLIDARKDALEKLLGEDVLEKETESAPDDNPDFLPE